MIEVRTRTTADEQAVWDVLADGWSYASWVVGASRVRAVSREWPAEGAVLHHSVGAWPLVLDDVTTVLHCVPRTELVLRARGWPLGEARIEMTLIPEDDGCTVVMREDAVVGPGRFVPFPLRAAVISPRNTEAVRRLSYLAERRSR